MESSVKTRNLDEFCSTHFRYRDLIECGDTYLQQLSSAAPLDNVPRCDESWRSLSELATQILDPVVDEFGSINLTYGFSGPSLARKVRRKIAPALDQHACAELNQHGNPICSRGGAAVDFVVPSVSSFRIAKFIANELPFDRVYFYGENLPLHVSVGPENTGQIWELAELNGRRIPRLLRLT